MERLEKAGYRVSETKSELVKREIEGIGHRIYQSGLKPFQDKLQSNRELPEPQMKKETKSFLEAIQYLSKFFENISES